ncbi:hypothetical protein N0V91_010871 [Didymella pomorum]|jgi:hypothetical protein|uniref:Right handed beta helix domain-containing protein n=1 Tax=Didymella pomorum TaxID=749634 RepID=A0A9W8Z0A8_9PLEO|nr:hypothetical protein N0V91_010871 [Didymella pomorum]
MPRSSFTYLRLLVLLAALLLYVSSVGSLPSPTDDKNDKDDDKKDYKDVIRVKGKDSIQDAIKRAKPYTRIEVEGHHKEYVTINKDGIALVGKGAKLSPPDYPAKNYCFGKVKDASRKDTSAGVCIHGKKIKLIEYGEFDLHQRVGGVGDPVRDVSVSGFEVVDFDGPNIAVYGGKNTKVYKNELKGGKRYGFLTVGGKGTDASNNIVIGSAPATLSAGPIAMCMDDFSSAVFSYNDLSDYNIGLCTETDEAINQNNKIHRCCVGNFIDPVKDAKCLDNTITEWNDRCPIDAAAGITLGGAKNALVKGNYISIGSKPSVGNAGLFLGLENFFGVNEGNTITKNKFGENIADIFNNSTGTNYIFENECDVAARAPLSSPIPAPEYCRPRGAY